MKTAIFFGAGASKTFGYPLTSEILPHILQRLDAGELFQGTNPPRQNAADRSWFRNRLFALLPGLTDTWKEARAENPKDPKLAVAVTDILTLVDRAIAQHEARADLPPDDLPRFRRLLDRAIYEVIVRGREWKRKPATDHLDEFERWFSHKMPHVDLITTNYDTAVDRRILKKISPKPSQSDPNIARKVDFGFSWRTVADPGNLVPRPAKPTVRLLNLHGSIRCLRCNLCGQIYLNTGGPIGTKAFARALDDWNTCHCNDWDRLELHLVTPSFLRQILDAHLLGIWQAALEVLRTARTWVLVGYSLPAEDVSIRSLLLRAWDGANPKPKVVVIQRSDAETEKRYRAFFPRRHFDYRRDGFEAFLRNPKF